MKPISILLLLFAPFVLITAQDSIHVDSSRIITKLKVGDSAVFGSKRITFIDVIEDSRCPSDISCIWAGQAKVIIGVYVDGVLKEEKEFIFGAKGINPNNTRAVLITDEKTTYGYDLSPYPSSKSAITREEYCLELLIK